MILYLPGMIYAHFHVPDAGMESGFSRFSCYSKSGYIWNLHVIRNFLMQNFSQTNFIRFSNRSFSDIFLNSPYFYSQNDKKYTFEQPPHLSSWFVHSSYDHFKDTKNAQHTHWATNFSPGFLKLKKYEIIIDILKLVLTVSFVFPFFVNETYDA